MKRILTLSLALCVLVSSYAGTNIVVPGKAGSPNANEIMVPVGKNGTTVSLMDLSLMKARDFEKLSGKKMKLVDKIGFKIIQKKLRNNINAKGEINTKILEKAKHTLKKADDKTHSYLRLWLILLAAAIILAILGWVVPFFWILSSIAGLGALIFFILWLLSMSGTV